MFELEQAENASALRALEQLQGRHLPRFNVQLIMFLAADLLAPRLTEVSPLLRSCPVHGRDHTLSARAAQPWPAACELLRLIPQVSRQAADRMIYTACGRPKPFSALSSRSAPIRRNFFCSALMPSWSRSSLPVRFSLFRKKQKLPNCHSRWRRFSRTVR